MYATQGTEDQKDGGIGAASIDRTWGIGHGYASSRASSCVNRVIASAIVRDEPQALGKDIDELLVETTCDLKKQ